jgi:hypothetical protein
MSPEDADAPAPPKANAMTAITRGLLMREEWQI